MSDEDRRLLFEEVLMDELKAIREGISNLPTRPEFNELKADVDVLKSDIVVVKATLQAHSRELKELRLLVS